MHLNSPSDATVPQELRSIVAIPRLSLTVVREGGKATERKIEFDGERIRIGSHPSNDLVLDDHQVSRFHCTLVRGPSTWSITDVGSLNGTVVCGIRIRDAELPPGGSTIEIGQSQVKILALAPTSIVRVPQVSQFGELYGRSLAMRQVFAVLERAAASDATILIVGESGTGKELAAQELVRRGTRASKPFLTVDASAISPNLIESELFGHVKGAFTGADRNRIGAFEAANGGTLFLDEIGEMPLDMQPKLLRALEAREIRRTGENEPRKINVRVIAATNRPLEREVNRGRFREDLFFRLSVIVVRLPPLRERTEDVPLLVSAFLERMGVPEQAGFFTPDVLQELGEHDWPGNVRELRNYVERALVLEDAKVVRGSTGAAGSLVPEPLGGGGAASHIDQPFKVAKEQLVEAFEREYLTELMSWADGNVSRAARKAKIDRMHLHRLLQRYAIGRASTHDE